MKIDLITNLNFFVNKLFFNDNKNIMYQCRSDGLLGSNPGGSCFIIEPFMLIIGYAIW